MKNLILFLGILTFVSTLTYGAVICKSQVPCVYTGLLSDSTDCSQNTCAAQLVSTDSATTVQIVLNVYAAPGCNPNNLAGSTDPITLNFPDAGTYGLVATVIPPDQCPAGPP